MSIRVISFVFPSGVLHDQVYVNGNSVELLASREKFLELIPIDSELGRNLLSLISRREFEQIYNILERRGYDDFYKNGVFTSFNLVIPNIDTYYGLIQKRSKSGKRVQDLNNPYSWISRNTFIKRYRLGRKVMKLPYLNYNNNESELNCVYNFVMNHYGKGKKVISNKNINVFFNKDLIENKFIECDKIIEFCDNYKIKCILYNIAGHIIFNNNIETNTNYKDFIAIISCNHLYPYNNNNKDGNNIKHLGIPKFNEIKYDGEFDDDQITIKIGNKIYGHQGFKEEEISQYVIDDNFFKKIYPNFTFISEKSLGMKSLLYCNKDLYDKLVYEIDMNKAFYTIAYKILKDDDMYPIFTVSDIYEEYNKTDLVIHENYYYLISENSLKILKDYGIITNSLQGCIVKFFIENNIITNNDIEFVKIPFYSGEWKNVKQRINSISETCDIKKSFIFYNGLLGKLYNDYSKTISGIYPSDYNLLNDKDDYNDIYWLCEDCENDDNFVNKEFYTTFSYNKSSFRYINTVNIYNHIISQCNLFLLKTLFSIKNSNPEANLIKIRVDSLGFDRKIIIPDEFKEYYKILTSLNEEITPYHKMDDDKIKSPSIQKYSTYISYHDGNVIIKETENEFKCFTDNISIHGPPGSGKTYEVKVNYKGKYDFSTTFTNLCALNIGGETIHSLLKLYSETDFRNYFPKFKDKTIWIDEFSMINRYLFNYFFILSKMYNTKFIISGDINQISPVGESKIILDNKFFNSLMGKKIILEDREGFCRNDNDIRIFRNFINNNESATIHKYFMGSKVYDKFYEIYKQYENNNDNYLKYDRHISFTHATKRFINTQILKNRNYTFKFDKNRKLDASIGVILSCKKTKKSKNLYKNDMWKIMLKDGNGYVLKNLLFKKKDEMGNETNENILIHFPHNLMENFTLGFCITAHSSQGLSIDEDIGIHDIFKMIKSDKSLLYTALTRARKFKNVHFFPYSSSLKNDISELEYNNNFNLYINMDDDEEEIFYDKVKCNNIPIYKF